MIPRFYPNLNYREFFSLFKFNPGSVEKFEKAFAEKFNSKSAVSFSYGRSAQWAFLKALGINDKEIIMPAYTCSVVAHAVTLSGNKPVFVDSNEDDFNMNLDKIPKLINQNTRAIIATHTFGIPQDVSKLHSIRIEAEKKFGNKIWLINDCCHCFGAKWNEKYVGNQGDVAIYAFNISKMITSIFGGILTFNDKKLADKVRNWRNNNFKKPKFLKSLKRKFYLIAIFIAFNKLVYKLTFWLQHKTFFLDSLTKSFHLDNKIHFPNDYLDLMTNTEAAIGLIQLKKYDDIIEKRVLNSKWYFENISKKNWVLPKRVPGSTYSHYVIKVPNRKETLNYFSKNGIELGELIQYSIPDLNCYNSENIYDLSLKYSKNTINMPLLISESERKKIKKLL